MTRLALIALMSLILAAVLCYFSLRVAEAVAVATLPRIEITQQVEDSPGLGESYPVHNLADPPL